MSRCFLGLLFSACSFDSAAPGGGAGDPVDGSPGGGGDGSIGGRIDGGGGVLPDAAGGFPDADLGLPDADPGDACGGQCAPPGVCEEATGTCVFDCAGEQDLGDDGGGDQCDEEVVCPPGLPCRVLCTGEDTCGGGIDCQAATSCDIQCTGPRSCRGGGPIVCGPGQCDIQCTEEDTCTGGLICTSSCFCSITCTGQNSCSREAACPAGCDDAPGCETNGQCNNDCP